MFSIKVKFIYILLIFFFIQIGCAENKSVFGIGMRIIGDQLLLKDNLTARQMSADANAEVTFHYSIPEPITYIEILSDKNVIAKVDFSYQNDLVTGTVKDVISSTSFADTNTHSKKTFEVLITIYGFNKTMLNVSPAYILNRDQKFDGVLKAESLKWNENDADLVEASPELNDEFSTHNADNNEEYDIDNNNNNNNSDNNQHKDDIEYEFVDSVDEFEQQTDKLIELGQRVEGDYLIYETDQLSSSPSVSAFEPTNHSVVFYYIDDYFITYVKFIVFDHFIDKSKDNNDTTLYIKIYYLSHKTLKAKITDTNTTTLFVKMQIYGYKDEKSFDTFNTELSSFLNDANEFYNRNSNLNDIMITNLSIYNEKVKNMEQLKADSAGFNLKITKITFWFWLISLQLLRKIFF